MSQTPGTRKGQVRGDLPAGWRDQTARFTPDERAAYDLGPSYKRDDSVTYSATVAEDSYKGWRWDVRVMDTFRTIVESGWTTTALAGIRAADRYMSKNS
jgi:hypothetical protein